MATAARIPDRRALRRQETIEEALDHAVAIMGERGVGGLTMSELATRIGIRGPSLYKYFPSLHALYDALFARGLREQQAAVGAAFGQAPRGVARLHAGAVAVVVWSVANPALAQLLFWRPVPGFVPSPETFRASESEMQDVAAELREAVRLGELDEAAAAPDAVRMLTVVLAGIVSQQLANEPGVPFADGTFTRLTHEALDLYFAGYRPMGR